MLPNLDFLDEIIKQTQMMTDKEIITQIMLFPALFDASNNLFKNNEYQKTTWTKIANNLKQDVSEIKNRWCSIRQTLNNQLNFKKTANPHEIIDYEEELLPLILLLDPGYVKSANLQEVSATSPFEPQLTPEVLKTPENRKPSKKTSNPLLIKNKNPNRCEVSRKSYQKMYNPTKLRRSNLKFSKLPQNARKCLECDVG
ncbi:alcohol dehydrogenase transcription factor myb/SANT-like domain-containing protein [Phthorimaea operculella]|nr:alcohol dehydrogenase transcription factor myb/SANT-like domain-containing protein [Phthorimaea operculella]